MSHLREQSGCLSFSEIHIVSLQVFMDTHPYSPAARRTDDGGDDIETLRASQDAPNYHRRIS